MARRQRGLTMFDMLMVLLCAVGILYGSLNVWKLQYVWDDSALDPVLASARELWVSVKGRPKEVAFEDQHGDGIGVVFFDAHIDFVPTDAPDVYPYDCCD